MKMGGSKRRGELILAKGDSSLRVSFNLSVSISRRISLAPPPPFLTFKSLGTLAHPLYF